MAIIRKYTESLDSVESPTTRATIEYLGQQLEKAESREEFDIAKVAFVKYLQAVAPDVLPTKSEDV